METNDGGPAFPHGHVSELTGHFVNGFGGEGMSLRDWLAGKALAGIMVSRVNQDEDDSARLAYRIADAMLAARGGAK